VKKKLLFELCRHAHARRQVNFFSNHNRSTSSDFLCVKGEGIGEKGSRAESIFYLDKDAGCLETSRMLVESGLCLALQEDALPCKETGGGFMSPGAGLGTVLIDRLVKTGTFLESKGYPAASGPSKL
jgi:short subunit dehydrogenase-like uncharacterized protein